MSAALTAQPGLHRMAMAVSTKAKVKGKKRKRKKSTMAGGACATPRLLPIEIAGLVKIGQILVVCEDLN